MQKKNCNNSLTHLQKCVSMNLVLCIYIDMQGGDLMPVALWQDTAWCIIYNLCIWCGMVCICLQCVVCYIITLLHICGKKETYIIMHVSWQNSLDAFVEYKNSKKVKEPILHHHLYMLYHAIHHRSREAALKRLFSNQLCNIRLAFY